MLKSNSESLSSNPHMIFFLIFFSLLFLSVLEAYAREQTQIVQEIASKHNGSDFVFAEEAEAKKELWKVILCPFPTLSPFNLPEKQK